MASGILAGRGLAQAALSVTDLAAAVAFYRDMLGLPFLFETNGMAFFDMNGVRLMIGAEAAAKPSPSGCLYFDVPDLPVVAESLESKGIVFLGPAQTVQRTADGALQIRFFRDPDGNLLALMGMVAG